MTTFQVDVARVATAATKVTTCGTTLRAEAQAMVAHLVELGEVWQGGAASGFASVLAEWDAARQNLELALDSIGHALASTATTYEDAEASVQGFFAR